MKRLRFDGAARRELLHEVRYYSATRPGTGLRFHAAVKAALELIARHPEGGRPDEQGCRRVRVEGFPFSVVYREERTELVVYAVRPDAREPGYWFGRVKSS